MSKHIEVMLPVSGYVTIEIEVDSNATEQESIDMAYRSIINGEDELANEDIEEFQVHKNLLEEKPLLVFPIMIDLS